MFSFYTPHIVYKALSTSFALVRGQKTVKKERFFQNCEKTVKQRRTAHSPVIPGLEKY
jgi:hypothetical protein